MFCYFFGGLFEQVQECFFCGLGLGVIIDVKKGYVVINVYVVVNVDEIIVKLIDGCEFIVKKLGVDE